MAIAYVQGRATDDAGSLAYSGAVGAGSTLVLVCRNGASTALTDVTDSVNAGSWTKALSKLQVTDGHTLNIWFKVNSGAGTPTVSVTGSGTRRFTITEFSGVDTTSTCYANNSATGTSSGDPDSGSATVVGTTLAIGGFTGADADTLTLGSPTGSWVMPTIAGDVKQVLTYILAPGAGALNATFNASPNDSNWAAGIALIGTGVSTTAIPIFQNNYQLR